MDEVKNAFPLPCVDDSLAALSGSRWFSALDRASSYWQVAMEASTQKKAAFVTLRGLYKWDVIAFGLCNAPGTFERLMKLVLKCLHWKICLIYLDDVIAMEHTFEEELERLKQVFERLACAGLKPKPKKSFRFQKRVSYLGHVCHRGRHHCRPWKGRTSSPMAHTRKQHGGQKFSWTCLLLPPFHL